MAVYTAQINSAFEAIKAKGRVVTVTQTITGAYDPATTSTAASTSTALTFYGITLPATQSRIESFETRYEDSKNLINRNIRFLMLAAKGATFEPRQNDVVTMGGLNYSVMGVTKLDLNGEDIIYKMGIFR